MPLNQKQNVDGEYINIHFQFFCMLSFIIKQWGKNNAATQGDASTIIYYADIIVSQTQW